ncbi:hypothetical protein Gohar_009419, partial [Gossypium harknessii]|nr:hypothetical protein [Gossypium harknessii]
MIGISYAISGSMVGADEFDLWMLVERKTRHNPREHNNFGIGQSKGTGYALRPGGDFADLLEVPSNVFGRRVGGTGDMVTFIPASFRVLNTKKDITVVFQENSNPNLTKVHVDNEAFKSGMPSIPIKGWDSGGKVVCSKRGWKINKTLKGSSNRFKVLGSSRVSLAESMLFATDLISSELDGQVIKKTVMEGKDGPECVIIVENSGFKVDAIIAKLGLKRSHRVEVVGFSR